MLHDLRYALRVLLRTPGFTLVAVLSLALGIGANTAIFSVVKAVLLEQLPYRQPERLVHIAETSSSEATTNITVDFATTHDWRERSRSFEHLSLYRGWNAAVIEQETPELVRGMRVGYDFFDALGVPMLHGRTFSKEEDQPGRSNVMILSHALWLRRFGGDPSVVGRTVRLNESSFQVVGILPAHFRPLLPSFDNSPEMYAPLGYGLGQSNACRGCQHLRLLGRLKPGVPVSEANADLNKIMQALIREYPTEYCESTRAMVTPLRDQLVGKVSTALWVLLGAVGLVLLIACGNVANLLLSRATGRAREIAVRTALGAGRRRLIRQLLTESMLLALAGGIAGVVLASAGTSALSAVGPREIPRVAEIRIDTPVLLFSLTVSLLTGVLFGLAPALRASRVNFNEALKDAAKSTEGPSGHGLRNLLVTAEVALAFVLVVGAGLLGKSFLRLMNVDPGYDPQNVLTLSSYLYGARYQTPEVERNYYDQIMERLRATPGVDSVAMVSTLPLASFDRRGFHIRDRRLANNSEAPSADAYSVTPDYFRVMRIPLKRGRTFTAQDGPEAPRVALISESCARSQFPGEDPIGKQIQLGGRNDDRPWAVIIGVTGDIRAYGLDRPSSMEAYIPLAQNQNFAFSMVVRTVGDPRGIEGAVREAFQFADKTQPIFGVAPLETYLRATLAERSFTLTLLGLFGTLALTLAAVGIYGVISYAVSLRTREVGIRMALGAQRSDVLAMVLRQGLILVGSGLAVGFLASLALTRFLSTLLYEVRPTDLATSAAVAVVVAAVALLASYLPARRATRVDPMVALRYE